MTYEDSCLICLQGLKYHNGKNMLVSPCCCGKFFHADCIYEMATKSLNELLKCPQCRKIIIVPNIVVPSSKLIKFKLWHTFMSKTVSVPSSIPSSLSLDEIIHNEQCRKCDQQLNIRGGDKPILTPGCCGMFYHVACFNDLIQTIDKATCPRCNHAYKVPKVITVNSESFPATRSSGLLSISPSPHASNQSRAVTRTASVVNLPSRVPGISANWDQLNGFIEMLLKLLVIICILGAVAVVIIIASFIIVFLYLWYRYAYLVAAVLTVGLVSVIMLKTSSKEIRSFVISRLLK